ncbi:hypothetical protein [Tenacibaculum sp. L6]|uniref:hypothetical protein n=1 Tax=Tenacibaculum sp. L6 TaxID=2992764 RepID=UPI00237A6DB0|nr:hypothetical protein [Tenacibaculum sp. L6]MDE0536751.1 hypothetical protein [Tenacibaculum sp. L6]
MNKKLKILYRAKLFLTLGQILSVAGFIMLFFLLKSSVKTINKSKEYIKESVIIDSMYSNGGGSRETNSRFAKIKDSQGNVKIVLLPLNTIERDTASVGEKLLVWNIQKPKGSIILRYKGEEIFPIHRYKQDIFNVIFFFYIPFILIWIARYLVNKRIKKLEILASS